MSSSSEGDGPAGQPSLRELARQEPEAVRAVAERAGGELGDWLNGILEEEQNGGS